MEPKFLKGMLIALPLSIGMWFLIYMILDHLM